MMRPPIANAACERPLLPDNAAVRRHLSLDALLPAIETALIVVCAGRVVQPMRTVMELPGPGSLLFFKPALADSRVDVPGTQGEGRKGPPCALAATLIIQMHDVATHQAPV